MSEITSSASRKVSTLKEQSDALNRYEELLSAGVGARAAQSQLREEIGVAERTLRRWLKNVSSAEPRRDHIRETYIVTAWELRSVIDYRFVYALRQLADDYNAPILLSPCYLPDIPFLPSDLRNAVDEILTTDKHFNENLFFKFVETHALLKSPLTGWKGFSEKTAIINGLVKELVTLPSSRLCKQMMSTGSIGYFDTDRSQFKHIDASADKRFKREFDLRWAKIARSQKKTTAIAREFIKPSAVIIHVLSDKRFLTRYVTQEESGRIHDLNFAYSDATKRREVRPLALNVGDTHAWYADESAIEATFEQIRTLKPRHVLLNDFFDGISVNHHEIRNIAQFDKAPSITEELEVTLDLLMRFKEVCDESDAQLCWISSNHEDFIERVLDRGETSLWRVNRNYATLLELELKRVKRGESRRHPILDLIDLDALGIRYIDTEDSETFGRVIPRHGHESVSGRRVGFRALAEHFNYLSQAHTHSPAVFRNAVCAGTTARFNMPYVTGINGWMHANVIIHEDGSQQLIPIIEGVW